MLVRTRPGVVAQTAKSNVGPPASERSMPHASHSTPSSKGATPSYTIAATL